MPDTQVEKVSRHSKYRWGEHHLQHLSTSNFQRARKNNEFLYCYHENLLHVLISLSIHLRKQQKNIETNNIGPYHDHDDGCKVLFNKEIMKPIIL